MITITLLIAAGTCIVTSLLLWVYRRRSRQKLFKRYGIPGPNPSFFLGNLQQMRAAPTPKDVFSSWLEEYGNMYGFFIGEIPLMMINDVEVLKHIMIRDFSNFTNRMPFYIEMKPLTESLFCLPSSRWKEVRSILTPTFSSSKIKLMFKVVDDKVSHAVDVVSKNALRSESFDIHNITKRLALDVIADSALAMKVNSLKNPKDPFYQATEVFFRTAQNTAVDLALMFPMLRLLFGFIASRMTAGKMTDVIVQNLRSVIQYRQNNPTLRGTDLLQLLLDSSELNASGGSSDEQQKKVQLTDDEIIGNAYITILAGYETTANALAYVFYLLTQHPDIQEKLYQELVAHCPADGELTYDILHNLQYLDQVFSESLRIYPPVTGFITRQCKKECQIGPYIIPKDVVVQVPVWRIHHDPELWPDPWKFDPERFSPENTAEIEKMAYIPFGIGPRNCIGMRFAKLEAKLAIARLVKAFEFVPCEKTEKPLILTCPTVITIPKNGVFLQARLRKSYSGHAAPGPTVIRGIRTS